jgi:hypothetical protein
MHARDLYEAIGKRQVDMPRVHAKAAEVSVELVARRALNMHACCVHAAFATE